jgi:hypothetical protein
MKTSYMKTIIIASPRAAPSLSASSAAHHHKLVGRRLPRMDAEGEGWGGQCCLFLFDRVKPE